MLVELHFRQTSSKCCQSVSSGTDRYSSRHISQNSWSKAEVKDKHLTFRVNAKDTMLEARPTGLRTDNQLSTMS